MAATKSSIPVLHWRDAKPSPIVLVSGAEGFLADRATSLIRDQLRALDAGLEVSDLDASSYPPGQLLTLASPSLFAEPRLIRVANVQTCNDDFLVEILDYLASPDPDTVVVLRHSGGVRGKKFLDTVRGGTVPAIEISCAEVKSDSDKYDFAAAEFQSAGRRIEPSALRSLVSAFSGSLTELASACQQLLSDVSGDISDRTVEDYYGGRAEVTAFKVVDLAVAGRQGDSLLALRHALASGADPVPIVAAFANKLRLMAKLYGDRTSSAQLASQVGAAPWQIDRARKDLQGWTENGLGNAMEAIAQADANVKGASRAVEYSLERMVSIVAQYGRL